MHANLSFSLDAIYDKKKHTIFYHSYLSVMYDFFPSFYAVALQKQQQEQDESEMEWERKHMRDANEYECF